MLWYHRQPLSQTADDTQPKKQPDNEMYKKVTQRVGWIENPISP
jgi:hypothetical protein